MEKRGCVHKGREEARSRARGKKVWHVPSLSQSAHHVPEWPVSRRLSVRQDRDVNAKIETAITEPYNYSADVF